MSVFENYVKEEGVDRWVVRGVFRAVVRGVSLSKQGSRGDEFFEVYSQCTC